MTIKDIAKICGVGIGTVSRAINNEPGVSPATREKILKVVEENGFVPNSSAKNLKAVESHTIALLVKGIDNIFFEEMLRIFEQELQKLDYSYVVVPVAENQDESKVALSLVRERRLKGVIFLGGLLSTPDDGSMDSLDIPCVRCTVANPDITVGNKDLSVSIDDRKEARRAVSYLLQCGHKRVAMIAAKEDDTSVGTMRLAGYKDALLDASVDFDSSLVCPMHPDYPEYTVASGYHTTKALLESGTDFTALFTISDMVAFGAYKAIKEKGLSIPDDISVMGFDGLALTEYFHPALTTISQPTDQMVTASIELLIKAIESDDTRGEHRIYMAELIERDSVKKL